MSYHKESFTGGNSSYCIIILDPYRHKGTLAWPVELRAQMNGSRKIRTSTRFVATKFEAEKLVRDTVRKLTTSPSEPRYTYDDAESYTRDANT